MRGVLHLAWRYLAAHPVKTAILVAAFTLTLYLPVGLRVLVDQGERRLAARAAASPLLVGKKGSPLELVLSSLYFSDDVPETIRYAEVRRVGDTGFGTAVPLYVRFRAGDHPIVGTSLDYFAMRRLAIDRGAQMARLGDCVLGARVAEAIGIGPGGHVISSPESVFDLAGVYPLKMRVTGVLARSEGPDDDAIFVDVKTAWVIEGLAHGHEDLSRPEAAPRVLVKEGNVYRGNASVPQYTEVTDANADSFHFHGDAERFPITAVLVFPRTEKAATLLRGRYLAPDEPHQVVRPVEVVDRLMDTVFAVEGLVVAGLAVVGVATLLTAALVFALSIRVRRRELETMVKIGGGRSRIAAVLILEMLGVIVAGAIVAGLLVLVTASLGEDAIRLLVR